jgi:purine catabolism regulator
VGITIGELVTDPILRTSIQAGQEGSGRSINWAHACELAAPWEWLGQGDLLMTNGFAVPVDRDEQAAFVERLDAAGLSGIAIGQDLHAPPVHQAMLETADRLGFPILYTAYDVPFAALSRAVVVANRREDEKQLQRMVRVYDRVRVAAIDGHDTGALIGHLADEIDSDLHVVTPEGTGIFAASPPLEAPLRTALGAELSHRQKAPPAVLRLTTGGHTALVVPVPSGRDALLIAEPRGAAAPSLGLLQHVATIVALEVEKLTAEREQQRRLGSELLTQILDAKIDGSVAAEQLRRHGVQPQDLCVAALERDTPPERSDLHVRLAERAVPHVLLRRGETLLVLFNSDPPLVDALVDEAGPDVFLGLSDPVAGPARVPDAAREAQWALRAARSDGSRVGRYGENREPFLPRTIGEAGMVVERILGPLLAYDRDHNAELVHSLDVFLRANRSWQRAVEGLYVHKQTLVYRMKRVEELTGRRLDDTGDVAELWLALQALKLIGWPEPVVAAARSRGA